MISAFRGLFLSTQQEKLYIPSHTRSTTKTNLQRGIQKWICQLEPTSDQAMLDDSDWDLEDIPVITMMRNAQTKRT